MDFPRSFEVRTAGWNEEVFTRFCNGFLCALAARHYGPRFVPSFTERTKAPDEGVDALIEVKDTTETSGGVVGPGLSVYQYKFIDPASERSQIQRRILDELKSQVPKIRARYPASSRYVLLTNRDLGPHNSKIRIELRKAFADAWGSDPPALELLGGAEIGSSLADYPAIDLSFGPDAAFETNSGRLRALRALGRPLGAPDDLIHREKDKAALTEFLQAQDRTLLFVIGPPRIGKTFLLAKTIEGLPEWMGKTVWLHGPGQNRDLRADLRNLAASGPAAVVFDDFASREQARQAVAVSREFPDITAIFLFREELTPSEPAAAELRLEAFDFEASEDFLKALRISDRRLAEWIRHCSGGVPGVMLEYAAAAGALQEGMSGEEILARTDEKLFELFLGDEELGRFAAWIALCGGVNLAQISERAAHFADFLGLSLADGSALDQKAEALAKRGVLKKLGPQIRFEGPFLLRVLVRKYYLPRAGKALEFLATSSVPEWSRLVELLEAERRDPAVRDLANSFLQSVSPFFDTLEDLARNADLFAACGRIVPAEAADLAKTLFRSSRERLGNFLGGASFWKVLRFLNGCFYETGAEIAAAGALIEATVAEEKEGGSSALVGSVGERYLYPLWSRLHWTDIEVTLADRFKLIEKLAGSSEDEARLVALRACDALLGRWILEVRSPTARWAPPARTTPVVTLGEVRSYFEMAAALLARLLSDSNNRVSERAFESLTGNVPELIGIGVPPIAVEGILEKLVQGAKSPEQRNLLRDTLRSALDRLKREGQDTAAVGWRTDMKSVVEKGLSPLQPHTSFEDEVAEVFSNLSSAKGRRSLWEWSPTTSGKLEPQGVPLWQQALDLARQTAGDPALLSEELHEYLAGAELGSVFWRLVGQEDAERRWRDRLLDRAFPWRGFFADYAAGWTAVSSTEADEFLDRLLEDSATHQLVFSATRNQEPTPRRARRVQRIVEEGTVHRGLVARSLDAGAWLARLEEKDSLPILRSLAREEDAAVLRPLLRLMEGCLRSSRSQGFGPETRRLAWEVLERAVGREGTSVAYEWQLLAAALVATGGNEDRERGFKALEKLAGVPWGRFAVNLPSALKWPDFARELSAADRSRFSRSWLEFVVHLDPARRMLLLGEGPIDPRQDKGEILKVVGDDPEKARAIFATLSGNEPGFLDLISAVLDRLKESQPLWAEIAWRFAFGDAIWGQISEHLSRKIREIRESLADNAPRRYRRWAEFAVEHLNRDRKLRERWEFVRGFWDGEPSPEEAGEILSRPRDDAERRWLVRRLLENEKRGLAREILGDEEIEHALDHDGEIAPEVAASWRSLVGKRAPAWTS